MNRTVLIGRPTKDPELRYIPSTQTAVATFILAVDRPFDKDKADFIKITAFGKTAENCERFLKKGKLVGIDGRIQTDSYKDKEGKQAYSTGVIAERVQFLQWGDKTDSNERLQNIPEGFEAIDNDDDIPF